MADLTKEETIQSLVDLMEARDLIELELADGDQRVRVVRRGAGVPVAAAVAAIEPATSAEVSAGNSVAAPMTGTFYRASAPGAEPFVEVGQQVEAGAPLCIIESMKMMNAVEAPHGGTVVAILVDNGAPVDAGQALFRIA